MESIVKDSSRQQSHLVQVTKMLQDIDLAIAHGDIDVLISKCDVLFAYVITNSQPDSLSEESIGYLKEKDLLGYPA